MNRAEDAMPCTVLVATMVLVVQAVGLGAEPYAELDRTAHAKGIVVLKVFSPAHGTFTGISLSMSTDGETYEPAGAGFPRPSEVFSSVAQSGRGTEVCVPIVGRAGYMEYEAFLFEEPGTYYLRWGVGLKDGDSLGFKVYQTIEVAPPSAADVNMLAALSDWGFLSRLSLTESFKNIPDDAREFVKSPEGADFRALKVIGRLLEGTRKDMFFDVVHKVKTSEERRIWADALRGLAEHYPKSSYAPYAAYYAACCYSSISVGKAVQTIRERRVPGERKNRAAEFEQRALLIKKDADYARALKAFAMATEHADDYLKPKAFYQVASLRASAGDLDAAEVLLEQTEPMIGNRGTMYDLVAKLHTGIAEARQVREAGKASNVDSSD